MKTCYLLEITLPDGARHFFRCERSTWASARSWQKRIEARFPTRTQSAIEVVDNFTPALNLAKAVEFTSR